MRPAEHGVMPLALPVAADEAPAMDEEAFRTFYDRTARPVWAYLRRLCGDPALADDLLQETYFRFVRAARTYENDAHRMHYLFKVAASVATDVRRSRRPETVTLGDSAEQTPGPGNEPGAFERRADVTRAMARLRPRDREMLWLAYAQGSTHDEIARQLGVGRPSIKTMLSRARRRLAVLLGPGAAPGRTE
jgi:RNA polymerase sigma-70 factor, ECF subfamily